jgi:hypothetical protein
MSGGGTTRRAATSRLALLAILVIACPGGGGGSGGNDGKEAPAVASLAECAVDGVYVVGSSYSWDARPAELDTTPEWHIFCGNPLDFIFDNPFGHCVASSTPWPDVLDPPAEVFDYISFQPVPNGVSTLRQDADAITAWLADQPLCSRAVLHATWPEPANWEVDFHEANPDHTLTNFSLDYIYELRLELERMNPGRRFILTRSNEMIDYIRHDPAALVLFDDLFRDDSGHMSQGPGGYLQHNAMRQAMGQATGIDVTTLGVNPAVKSYLDFVVGLHPDGTM